MNDGNWLLHQSGHFSSNAIGQRRLENDIAKDLKNLESHALGHSRGPARTSIAQGLRPVPSTAGSERPLTPIDYSMPDLAAIRAKQSPFVRLYEERKAATEEALGPTFDCPQPRIRLVKPRPRTPTSDDTDAWRDATSKLEKPVVARLLVELQKKLDREQRACKAAENRLQRAGAGALRLSGSSSLSSLPLHERAMAAATSQCTGFWQEGAAGRRVPVMSAAVAAPVRKSKGAVTGIARPSSSKPSPMATF